MPIFLPGYVGTIWSASLAAVSYGAATLDPKNPAEVKALAVSIATTLKNAISSIDASMMAAGLQQLYANLSSLLTLPIILDTTTTSFVINRLAAIQAAALSVVTLTTAPKPIRLSLADDQPSISDPHYAEWLIAFNFEIVPPTLDITTLVALAQDEATAWMTVIAALRGQGVAYTGTTLNTVQLLANTSQEAADLVAQAALSPLSDATVLWNQMVAMPAITRAVSAMANDPTSLTAQNTAIARYIILQALQGYNALLVSLRDTVVAEGLRLGTVRMGDTSLMTFAAREMNDYTAWTAIAALNGLEPPYLGTVAAPGVAVAGQQLFLPPANGAAILPAVSPRVPSYLINYLGVDRYLGPMNAPMLAWQGDYQVITGYQNLTMSLGRRLQTTLGNLIYHNLYGSRVPPELGAITDDTIGALLVEYTNSCLLSDPRVNNIVSCIYQFLGNYSVEIEAVVLPNGLGQTSVAVNEVIGPP